MFWLLPLAAVPVVLHLLSRMAPPSLRFPPVRFLRPTPMPLRGRRRWQDLLLMFLRSLLTALAVLLAAVPRWEIPPEAQSQRRGICAVLDSSASMEACVAGLREEARGLPGETLFWSLEGERLVPCTADDWSVGAGSAFPETALSSARDWLAEFPATGRELHLFSDLQTGNWTGNLPAMPMGTQVVIHTPPKPVNANCGITGVTVEGLSQGQLRLLVHVRNWGDVSAERQIVLLLDGRETAHDIRIPGNSSSVLPLVVEAPRNPRGAAHLTPSDEFAFDDSWHFWACPEEPHPVLAVFHGGEEETAQELETYGIPALTAEPEGTLPRYDVSILDVTGMLYADLSDMAAVFLFGAAEGLEEESLDKLRVFVEEGGVLFAVPGASPVAGWRALQGAKLAPAGSALLERRPTGIGAVPPDSALSALFPAKAASDLHLFSIRKYLRVEIAPTDSVLLSTLEDTPALLRRNVGKGQVFLFTFGFDHASSEFPLSRSFLPLLRELLSQALAGHSETIRITCGESLPALKSLAGEDLTPEGEPTTAEAGLFRYGRHLVEVNPPVMESVPQYAQADEVQRVLTRQAPERQDSNSVQTEDTAMPLTLWIALALLACLLTEALLATRSGKKAQ